jgi:hypothetical protein
LNEAKSQVTEKAKELATEENMAKLATEGLKI